MNSIRIVTGCRLHFGLIAPFGITARHGGCGLMLDGPGVELVCSPAPRWSVSGLAAGRLRCLLDQLLAVPDLRGLSPRKIEVRKTPPEHVGLGSGTQVSLAFAQALAVAATGGIFPAVDLARWTGRGKRSGIGSHGFASGGFLAEAPRSAACHTPDAVQRVPIPATWRFLLAIPSMDQGRFGPAEEAAFAQPAAALPRTQEQLADLIQLVLLPGLLQADLSRFGGALTNYNRLAGSFYRAVQGGDYSSPWISRAVELLLEAGAAGAGQSSWGPTVFGLFTEEQAEEVRQRLINQEHWAHCQLLVCKGRNQGAEVQRGDAPSIFANAS